MAALREELAGPALVFAIAALEAIGRIRRAARSPSSRAG